MLQKMEIITNLILHKRRLNIFITNLYKSILSKFTLGTGGGLVLHALLRSLHRYLINESISGLELYRYSATSVSEYPITCKYQITNLGITKPKKIGSENN